MDKPLGTVRTPGLYVAYRRELQHDVLELPNLYNSSDRLRLGDVELAVAQTVDGPRAFSAGCAATPW